MVVHTRASAAAAEEVKPLQNEDILEQCLSILTSHEDFYRCSVPALHCWSTKQGKLCNHLSSSQQLSARRCLEVAVGVLPKLIPGA